jgi:hypothetical protein
VTVLNASCSARPRPIAARVHHRPLGARPGDDHDPDPAARKADELDLARASRGGARACCGRAARERPRTVDGISSRAIAPSASSSRSRTSYQSLRIGPTARSVECPAATGCVTRAMMRSSCAISSVAIPGWVASISAVTALRPVPHRGTRTTQPRKRDAPGNQLSVVLDRATVGRSRDSWLRACPQLMARGRTSAPPASKRQ